MHTIQRQYRLVHLGRRSWLCTSLSEAMRIIVEQNYAVIGWYLPEYLKGLGDIPFRHFPKFSACRSEVEESRNYYRWVIYDESDLIVPLWRIKEILQQEGFRFSEHPRDYRRTGDWSRYRGATVEYTRCHRPGHYFRQVRHYSEKRERERTDDELREYGIEPPRHKYIPSNYDDVSVAARRNRNWKRHRRTQYRT